MSIEGSCASSPEVTAEEEFVVFLADTVVTAASNMEAEVRGQIVAMEVELAAVETEINAVEKDIFVCFGVETKISNDISSFKEEQKRVETECEAVAAEIDLVTGGGMGPVEHSILVCQLKCLFAHHHSLKDEILDLVLMQTDLYDLWEANKNKTYALMDKSNALEDKQSALLDYLLLIKKTLLEQVNFDCEALENQVMEEVASKPEPAELLQRLLGQNSDNLPEHLVDESEKVASAKTKKPAFHIPEKKSTAGETLEPGEGSGETLESSVSDEG